MKRNKQMREGNAAAVSAQLVEWSVTMSEVRIQSSANFYVGHLFVYRQLYWKDENKEKDVGNGTFLQKTQPLPCRLKWSKTNRF